MIDIATEKLITLSEAAGYIPPRRKGRRTHTGTIYRWAARGLRGVRLETIRVGGSLCTSPEKLQLFFNRLSELDGGSRDETKPLASDPKRVERQLDQARIG
jgi:hypothetical protein